MRVAPTITLSPEERARLLRRQRGHGPPAERASVVLLAARGWQDVRIARQLGISRRTAARWRGRFLSGRLGGLEDVSPAYRTGTVGDGTVRAILRETLRSPAPFHRPPSSRGLGRRFGVSHMTVRRVWDAYGVRPLRFAPLPPRPDPVAAEAPWDIADLRVTGELASLVLTLHPVPGSEGRKVLAPTPGHGVGSRQGATGASVATGQLIAASGTSLSATRGPSPGVLRGLLGSLATVESWFPDGPSLRVIATGVPAPSDDALRGWALRHPRVRWEIVPDLAVWRRRAADELDSLARAHSRSRRSRVPAETAISLVRSIEDVRPGMVPFRWSASRADLAAGEASYRLRYELSVTGHPGFYSPDIGGSDVPRTPAQEDLFRRSARTVLRDYLRLRPRERLTVETWTGTLDYSNALALECLRIGAQPLTLYQDEPTYWAATTEVPARYLAQVGDHRRAALVRSDAFISFFGPSDRERFHSLPSATRFRLGEYQDGLYDAAARSGARVVQMAIGRASAASAKMYRVDLDRWRAELLEATAVPPRVLHRRGARVARRLKEGHQVEIRHPNGTRLDLRLRNRVPMVSDGMVAPARRGGGWSLVTLPAGVVSVALDERYAEGSFRSNVPASTALSYAVGWYEGANWEFSEGRLRNASYVHGQELFAPSYEAAGEGRDRPACLSIGLNEKIDRAPLLEDQGLGTVTLQIGRNDHLGGNTRGDWWAWSLLRGADVRIDGSLIVRRGRVVE